jgi:uncharacterized protein (TIGR02145 family)
MINRIKTTTIRATNKRPTYKKMKKQKTVMISSLLVVGLMLSIITGCSKTDDTQIATIVKDIDGNVYDTVKIGTQIWMVQNLKTTRYRNGDSIPNVTDAAIWANLTSGGYSNYSNELYYGTKYGRLYNWYAVSDSRNLAPAGWHVATSADWTALQDYLIANGYNYDGSKVGNKIAKSLSANTDWYTGGTTVGSIGNDLSKNNKTGFTALPSGYRIDNGSFANVTFHAFWWTTTESSSTNAVYCYLHFSDPTLTIYPSSKKWGRSVRCVKD